MVNSISGSPVDVKFDASGRVVAVAVGHDVLIVDYKVGIAVPGWPQRAHVLCLPRMMRH